MLDFTVSGTEITILSMAPNPFSPESGETATLTASGSVGGTDLVVKIRPANDGNIFANVVLSEGPDGTYTGTWDGMKTTGSVQMAWPGYWRARTYNTRTCQYLGPWLDFTIPGTSSTSDLVTALIATPTPFAPEWGETTAATATGKPGATGLQLRVYAADLNVAWPVRTTPTIAFTETAAGTYTAVWDGKKSSGVVVAPDTYALRVYNSVTGQLVGRGTG